LWSIKLSFKKTIIIEHEIIVELSGTPLERPSVASLRATGGGGRDHLGTIIGFSGSMQSLYFCEFSLG